MTTEATEKDRPEKAPEVPVEETGTIYSDAPDAGPPGSSNAPSPEAPPPAPETPENAPQATETADESSAPKKGK